MQSTFQIAREVLYKGAFMMLHIFGNRVPEATHGRAKRSHSWQFFGIGLTLCLLTFMTHAAMATYTQAQQNRYAATSSKPVSTKSLPTPTKPTQNTTKDTSTPKAIPAATNVPTLIPNCVPISTSLPGIIDLSNRPAGLTTVIEPTTQYRIYGNTSAELRQQIQNCGPRADQTSSIAEFTGQTSFQASWRFDYSNDGTGNCHVMNAKISMHVMVIEPTWQTQPAAQPTLSTQWQSFVTSLDTHEQGHVVLSKQYAAQMLSDLQTFPVTSCNGIQTSVNAVMQNDISALNVANDQYDTRTNHGASQGAVLPR